MSTTLENKLAKIELLVLDVDGVLTDGRLLYGTNGEIGKTFNVKDGLGMKRLMQHDIVVAAISARPSDAAAIRLSELGLKHIYLACKDKQAQINKLQSSLAISVQATAVVGDDVPDLTMMSQAGCSIAVADAADEIKPQVDWITTTAGGQGAVREVCDRILKARNLIP